jgi:hypothetical protein
MEPGASMEKDEVQALAIKLLAEMRSAAAPQDWEKALRAYEEFLTLKVSGSVRVEAGCLAARGLAASGERSAAREILHKLGKEQFKRAVHYEFLARAYLDVKQYADAARACETAENLRQAEASKKLSRRSEA